MLVVGSASYDSTSDRHAPDSLVKRARWVNRDREVFTSLRSTRFLSICWEILANFRDLTDLLAPANLCRCRIGPINIHTFFTIRVLREGPPWRLVSGPIVATQGVRRLEAARS